MKSISQCPFQGSFLTMATTIFAQGDLEDTVFESPLPVFIPVCLRYNTFLDLCSLISITPDVYVS